MKKIITLALCLFLMLAGTASALSWNQTEPVSPYKVEVVPLTVTTSIFGQELLQRFVSGTVKAGETVCFVVRVTVPEKPAPAVLRVSAKGLTLNCPLSATLPTTQGQWYLDGAGGWNKDHVVLRGVVTDAASAAITAEVSGNVDLKDVALGNLTVTADSGGYLWSNGRTGMFFSAYGSGQVYGARVSNEMGSQRVSQSLLMEDTELGSIARYYLRTLGIDGTELLSGGVYMTAKLIQSNFGIVVDTSASFSWAQPTPLPLTSTIPVATVPATGMPWDMIACGFALVCVICVIAVSLKSKRR